MLDIKFLRTNPEVVKQNIRNKFQDEKLPLVDEVIELDKRNREIKQEVEALRAEKNKASKQIGAMMAQKKLDEAEALKKKVAESAGRIDELSVEEKDVEEKIRKIMMTIPNIIDPSVPIGKDDSENVELERFGDPVVPDFEIPYHTEIMESFNGIDLDSARKVAGNGFYTLWRHCKTPLGCDRICKRFYDKQRIHLLCSSVYDPQQCSDRSYEFRRDGCHDVQDRRRRPVPDRYERALNDR